MAITKLNSLAIPPDTIVESDLSYPLTNFSSTGIDDNATSTAITINSSQNVGIGVTDVKGKLSVIGPDSEYKEYLNVGHSTSSARLHFTPWSTIAQDRVYLAHNIYRSSSGGFGNDKTGIGMSYVGFLDSGSIAFGAEGTASSAAPTERMRILSSGGITFNGDTAAANALDDYEEGTWNVTLGDGTTTSGTLTTGRYTKIGQVVIARFDALNNINTAGFGTNQNVHISLPFTSSSTGRSTGSVIVDSIDFNSRTSVCSKVPDSTSNALLTLIGSNLGDGAVKWSYLSSGASDIVDFCLVYTA
jgi:hypothetical protein